jgi:hypothetical protein
MRVEGNYWVAYYALTETMEGALELGRIAMTAVSPAHRDRKAAFMTMMQDLVSDILEARIGARPDWTEPRNAPEHERAGRA